MSEAPLYVTRVKSLILLIYGVSQHSRTADVDVGGASDYRGTSLTRKRTSLGPYRRPMPRVLGGSQGGGRFLRSEVTL